MPLSLETSTTLPVRGTRGCLSLSLGSPSEPCDSPASRRKGHVRTLLCHRTHPHLQPYSFVFASALDTKVSSRMSPRCVRFREVRAGCPTRRREPHRFTPMKPAGPRLFRSPISPSVFGSTKPAGVALDSPSAPASRRSSRPLPRRSVTSAAYPGPKNLSSKSAFSSTPAPLGTRAASSSELSPRSEEPGRFRRWPSPASPSAVSPDAFASPPPRFRAGEGVRSRSPFTPETNRSSLERFFGPSGRPGHAQRCCGTGLGPSTSANLNCQRRVASSGREPRSLRGSLQRDSVRCGLLHQSRHPLRRRRDPSFRAPCRAFSPTPPACADDPPHRTWGPATGGSPFVASFVRSRHESHPSRTTSRSFRGEGAHGLQPVDPPPTDALVRRRSSVPARSVRASRVVPRSRAPGEAGSWRSERPRSPAVSTTREGHRRERPRCDPSRRNPKSFGPFGWGRSRRRIAEACVAGPLALFARETRPGLTTEAMRSLERPSCSVDGVTRRPLPPTAAPV